MDPLGRLSGTTHRFFLIFGLTFVTLAFSAAAVAGDELSLFNSPSSDTLSEGSGFYRKSPSITNITAIVGDTVQFNCSLLGFANDQNHGRHQSFLTTSSDSPNQVGKQPPASYTGLLSPFNSFGAADFKLNPTWLKADPIYNQYGIMVGYKTENIIVTRKGIIAENLRDKMKLISENDEKLQILRISNVNIRNEG